MKRLALISVLALCSLSAIAQSPDDVVVTSGDIEITRAEFEAALANLPPEYQAYASGPGRKAFAKDFLRMKVLARIAEREKLAEQPEVKAQLDLMRSNLLANAQVERMSESIEIEDGTLQAEYDQMKSTLERASARHILVAFEGSPAAGEDALPEEEAKAKAEGLREQLVAGADFAELASVSDDTGSAARGGDLGTFGRGQMVPEFDQAVFSAETGELLPIVRTQFGYHVIEVTDRSHVPFEEVEADLRSKVTQEKLEQEIRKLEGDLELNAVYDTEFFGDASPEGQGESGTESR